jgi:hypothetical protein
MTHSSWQAGDAETDRLSPTERLPVDTGTPHINCSSGERAETGSSLDYIIRRGRWTHMKRRNLFEPDGELSGAPLRTRSGKRPDPESNPPRRGQRSRANRTAVGASGCWCSSRTGWSQTCAQSACPSKPTPAPEIFNTDQGSQFTSDEFTQYGRKGRDRLRHSNRDPETKRLIASARQGAIGVIYPDLPWLMRFNSRPINAGRYLIGWRGLSESLRKRICGCALLP